MTAGRALKVLLLVAAFLAAAPITPVVLGAAALMAWWLGR